MKTIIKFLFGFFVVALFIASARMAIRNLPYDVSHIRFRQYLSEHMFGTVLIIMGILFVLFVGFILLYSLSEFIPKWLKSMREGTPFGEEAPPRETGSIRMNDPKTGDVYWALWFAHEYSEETESGFCVSYKLPWVDGPYCMDCRTLIDWPKDANVWKCGQCGKEVRIPLRRKSYARVASILYSKYKRDPELYDKRRKPKKSDLGEDIPKNI